MSDIDQNFSPFELSDEINNIGKSINKTTKSLLKKVKKTNIFFLIIIVILLLTIHVVCIYFFLLKKSTLDLLTLIEVNKKNCDIKDDQPWD